MLGEGFVARVLEPSPPALDNPRRTDDPTRRGEVPPGVKVVSPVAATGDLTWDEVVAERPHLAGWVARRWLGGPLRLPRVPGGWSARLADYNRLAFYVVSKARKQLTGRGALRFALGGFGTPFFGDDEQLRVERGWVVRQQRGGIHHRPLTNLAEAADFFGVELDPADKGEFDVPDLDDPLAPFQQAAQDLSFLSDWYGFCFRVLEELRWESPGEVVQTRVWPEHFDAAIEVGGEGARASYGGSPGDRHHPEPYLYVAPWGDPGDDPYWNDAAFPGASLPYRALLNSEDPVGAALAFLREGRRRLLGL